MKLQTVNVTKSVCGILDSIDSFTDDVDGNKEAESLFISLVKEVDPNPTDSDIESYLDNGNFCMNGTELNICHSI